MHPIAQIFLSFILSAFIISLKHRQRGHRSRSKNLCCKSARIQIKKNPSAPEKVNKKGPRYASEFRQTHPWFLHLLFVIQKMRETCK
ncbi:MAG: hypothetical protein COX19_16050 [Desulfobacterales bacterium CG23_combo_of_CG06-09_8_20_14_all_51_8]|nr:MAG: hypothetical protein COX19_16050 [Desulfobacterales bacterium CG23_combo_of_CG06-09_8_20_14_all_51_8]